MPTDLTREDLAELKALVSILEDTVLPVEVLSRGQLIDASSCVIAAAYSSDYHSSDVNEAIVKYVAAAMNAVPAFLARLEQLDATPCYTLPEAVTAALAAGPETSRRRLTDTIRSAAREGRIHGAYKTPEGYWLLPVPSFEAWLAEHAEQKRGRPRKEISKYGVWILSIPTVFAGEYIRFYVNQTEADQLDAYTVEVWRRIISGEFYLVKRDSTGIVVGAFGPLDVREEFVNLPGVIDWSLDLAHTLWLDKALGSYEDVTIVG